MYQYVILYYTGPKILDTLRDDKGDTRFFKDQGAASAVLNTRDDLGQCMTVKVATQIELI